MHQNFSYCNNNAGNYTDYWGNCCNAGPILYGYNGQTINNYGLDDAKIGDIAERMKTGQKKAEIIFDVFYKKWSDYYEPIFRSLLLVVSHIANNNDIDLPDKNRYKDYLVAQMSQHEYTFMIFLYFYNPHFHELLDNVCENNVFFNETEEVLFRRLIFKHYATSTT